MASQVTTQIWSGNNGGYVENVYPLDGVLERCVSENFSAINPVEGINAFIWTRNTIDRETGDIYRDSFTTGAHASTNGNTQIEDYMMRANQVSRYLVNTLRGNEGQWGVPCTEQGDTMALVEAERTAFEAIVEEFPDRNPDIGLSIIDPDIMFRVTSYDPNEPSPSLEENEMEEVAGMLFVRVDVDTSDQAMSDAPPSSAQDGDQADD
ncbi:hypothetical protein L202_03934 [Cryptococcus amylolentus CBS 6039]|uniref:Uncharacterized protein n=1 Tax=Cryptococcus amylolentus CBS 6039 TaxID=1295533 RepID=A0A1E3HPN4_9TREE|nr:hypothetical protein L202_03934 [Cryptococcus amylolentus CBS 6039]ODN78287.1 hypothetical protein L202_03934 [Cryptococcus amylolentus CBS 6039]